MTGRLPSPLACELLASTAAGFFMGLALVLALGGGATFWLPVSVISGLLGGWYAADSAGRELADRWWRLGRVLLMAENEMFEGPDFLADTLISEADADLFAAGWLDYRNGHFCATEEIVEHLTAPDGRGRDEIARWLVLRRALPGLDWIAHPARSRLVAVGGQGLGLAAMLVSQWFGAGPATFTVGAVLALLSSLSGPHNQMAPLRAWETRTALAASAGLLLLLHPIHDAFGTTLSNVLLMATVGASAVFVADRSLAGRLDGRTDFDYKSALAVGAVVVGLLSGAIAQEPAARDYPSPPQLPTSVLGLPAGHSDQMWLAPLAAGVGRVSVYSDRRSSSFSLAAASFRVRGESRGADKASGLLEGRVLGKGECVRNWTGRAGTVLAPLLTLSDAFARHQPATVSGAFASTLARPDLAYFWRLPRRPVPVRRKPPSGTLACASGRGRVIVLLVFFTPDQRPVRLRALTVNTAFDQIFRFYGLAR